jgi:hypothetical protein
MRRLAKYGVDENEIIIFCPPHMFMVLPLNMGRRASMGEIKYSLLLAEEKMSTDKKFQTAFNFGGLSYLRNRILV